MEGDDGILHLLALCHLFGQSLGIGHYEQGGAGLLARCFGGGGLLLLDEGLDGRQRLGAQDFVGRVDLSVLDAALVAAGEERHRPFATNLDKVVVEIACPLLIVEHEDDDAIDGALEGGEEGGSCRAGETLQLNDGRLRGVHSPKFIDKCIKSGLLQHQVFDFHKAKIDQKSVCSKFFTFFFAKNDEKFDFLHKRAYLCPLNRVTICYRTGCRHLPRR